MELVELSDTFSRIRQTRNRIIKTLIIYYIFILLFKNIIIVPEHYLKAESWKPPNLMLIRAGRQSC